MVDLVIAMSKYGAVQSVSWDYSKIRGFEHVRSMVRNIILNLAEGVELPSLDSVFPDGEDHKFLITVPGRGPVCFRCQRVGHTRQNCEETYCLHCQSYGKHSTEECTVARSCANTTRPSAQKPEETSDFPMDEAGNAQATVFVCA